MGASQKDIKNQQQQNKELKTTVSFEQEIINLLKDRRGISKDNLSDQQDISNVIRSQTAELKFQNEEKRLLRSLTKDINKIATDSYSISKDEMGTTKTNLSLTAQQVKLDKTLVVLEQQRVKFAEQGGRLNSDIAGSIKEQQEEAKKLKTQLGKVAKDSETIGSSLGKKGFSGLADISKAIPGLRKFSDPFEEAAEAARKQAQSNFELTGSTKRITGEQAKANKQTNIGIDSYKSLRKGGMGAKKALEKAKVSAKAVKIGKLPGKKSLSPLMAGFKVLGPIIKKALGPISIAIAVFDAIMFFVKAIKAASVATARMSNNMLITRDAARELYTDIIPGIVGEFNEISKSVGGTTVTIGAFTRALASLNNELGLQLNLSQDFGHQTSLNVGEVAKMTENFGYSAKASKELFFEAMKTGKPLEEINRSIFGTVGELASATGIVPDFAKLLDKAAGISGNLKANFGGTVSEIATAVYKAQLLGLELQQMAGVSNNLLDFQSSIENEMKAELLLGRNLNLERAREAALMGDTETLMKEISNQAGTQKDFLKMNVVQRKALAGAVGLELNELADMFDKQAKMDALKKSNLEKINQLKAAGLNIDDKNFSLEKSSLQEIRVASQAAGKSEKELRKILGDQIYLRKQEEDATQKFNKALEQAKDAFARLVDGGTLDMLADILTGITESVLFSGFKEEGEARRISNAAAGTKDQASIDIANEALEAQKQATGVDDAVDVVGSAVSGAAVGAALTAWLGPGAAIGGIIGGLVGGGLALLKNVDDQKYADDTLGEARALQLINGADKVDDFIIRPGQPLVKFNKGDILQGGTNLEGGGNMEAILTRILSAIETGGDVYMDGNKVGKSLALSTSRMG